MRTQALRANGHPTDKIELIVLGGTGHIILKNTKIGLLRDALMELIIKHLRA